MIISFKGFIITIVSHFELLAPGKNYNNIRSKHFAHFNVCRL